MLQLLADYDVAQCNVKENIFTSLRTVNLASLHFLKNC